MSGERADRLAAWATGWGIGFLVLMVAWLVGNRVAGILWDPPVGPAVAIVGAALLAAATGAFAARSLARRVSQGPTRSR